MSLDYSDSLGGAIGLSGSPKDYDNVALHLLDMDAKAQKKPKQKVEDYSKWTKIDGNVMDWQIPEIQKKTNEFITELDLWKNSPHRGTQLPPELERKGNDLILFKKSKEREANSVMQTANDVQKLKSQPGWEDKYEIDDAGLNSFFTPPDGVSHAKWNEIKRAELKGGTFNPANYIKGKELPFSILDHVNKTVLPAIDKMTGTQTRSTPQPDGSVITTTQKTLSSDKIDNQLNLDLSNEKTRKGIEKSFQSLDPATQKAFNNSASKWYKDNAISLLEKNDIKINQTSPKDQYVNSGNGQWETKDYRFSVDSNGNPVDGDAAYNSYVASAKKQNPDAKINSKEQYLTYAANNLLTNEGLKRGTFIAATPKDKSAENKESSYRLPDGSLIKGHPIGVSNAVGAPMIILNVEKQKAIPSKVVKNEMTGGYETVEGSPAVIEQKAVPFSGTNKTNFINEYAGFKKGLDDNQINWGQNNIKEYEHADKKGQSNSTTTKNHAAPTPAADKTVSKTQQEAIDAFVSQLKRQPTALEKEKILKKYK